MPLPMVDLETSYALCRQVARRSAQNFYYAFWLLPRPKRLGMCALYAFLRQTDDVGDAPLATLFGFPGAPALLAAASPSDEVAPRRGILDAWRAALDRALVGDFVSPLLPAVVDTLQRFHIPPAYLHATLDGVAQDLQHRQPENFAELEAYCHRVAGVVGQSCISIWGFHDPAALDAARLSGIAFQLTNILRDLHADALSGRVYLPRDEMARFGYTTDDLRQGRATPAFHPLLQFQVARAEHYYQQSEVLDQYLTPEGRRVNAALRGVYRQLLSEVARRSTALLTEPVALSRWRKMRITAGCLLARPALAKAGT